MDKLFFVSIPLLLAALAALLTPIALEAQTTTTTATTHHHHFGNFLGLQGLGLRSAIILNPATAGSGVCTNPAFPVPLQTAEGTICVSASSATSGLGSGVINQPATELVILGHHFGHHNNR